MKRLSICLLLVGLIGISQGHAAQTTKWVEDTATLLLSPNSVASDGFSAVSSPYPNTNQYTSCRFEVVAAFGSNPNAGASIRIWILQSLTGAAPFADAPSSTLTTAPPNLSIAVTAGQATTRQHGETRCPPGAFTIKAQYQGTGVTSSGSGNTITVKPYTVQGFP